MVLYRSPELKSAVIEEKKFKHSPRVGTDNPLGPKILRQQEGLIAMVICYKFKKNLFNLRLYTHLFMIIYMYIAAGQGQTTPGNKILMSTETSCHFGHLLQVSKKSLRSLILYNFFMISYMYIAPGPSVASLQRISSTSDFKHTIS